MMLPLVKSEYRGLSFPIALPVTLTPLLLHYLLFVLLKVGQLYCLLTSYNAWLPQRILLTCLHSHQYWERMFDLPLYFIPPRQDLHKVTKSLLASLISWQEYILCSTDLIFNLNERVYCKQDEYVMQVMGQCNDLESSLKSTLSVSSMDWILK